MKKQQILFPLAANLPQTIPRVCFDPFTNAKNDGIPYP